jgi:[NiFe] hydrogenase diaphorase moiety large subunit
MESIALKSLQKFNKDKSRLMDILIDIRSEMGFISESEIAILSKELGMSKAEVEQTCSFYHFLSLAPTGKYSVYLNNSVVSCMMGSAEVAKTFEKEAGCKFGSVNRDGSIGLFYTSCIGMNDQEPAAIINGYVFTDLTPFRVKELIRDMKAGKKAEEMYVESCGDGANKEIKTIVKNNIRKIGPVLDPNYKSGEVLKNILPKLKPDDVIAEIKKSSMRGRGGAGFPTGMKWELCRKSAGSKKYVFCNADEGEPGTFKDRVILTERPGLLFEGMAVAGYAIGADEGIIYIRYEYKYMQKYLENALQQARTNNLLGKNISGIKGFDFDIRLQFGAGAYVCGEESALIESAEGKRGEPRDRPPFPVESGYLNCPTAVNNVETLCSAVKIMLNGGIWFQKMGTANSTGTKILSISGDCKYPGVYEIEWGFTVNDVLQMAGAENVQAVQVGGPSGSLIAPGEFDRILCYSDLATGGSIIIFNKQRDLLKDVVLNFTEFFIEESCGSCTTCRIIPVLLKHTLEKILAGHGIKRDIDDITEWSKSMKFSRCGLGQTAANPMVSSVKNFKYLYEERVQKGVAFDQGFDLTLASEECCKIVGRVNSVS